MKMTLSIDRCPVHGFYAVCVGNGSGGKRLTPSKCCGSWQEVRQWKFTPDEMRELADTIRAEADKELRGVT